MCNIAQDAEIFMYMYNASIRLILKYVYVYMCACTHVHMEVWKSEANLGYLSSGAIHLAV